PSSAPERVSAGGGPGTLAAVERSFLGARERHPGLLRGRSYQASGLMLPAAHTWALTRTHPSSRPRATSATALRRERAAAKGLDQLPRAGGDPEAADRPERARVLVAGGRRSRRVRADRLRLRLRARRVLRRAGRRGVPARHEHVPARRRRPPA